ncbi:hypothetical protein PENSPDRAFT_678653 [Peniophora sp. CONT]|nr:hypothetical protein PENSPDRAFT_678653 [Peniophora sp. CONT]
MSTYGAPTASSPSAIRQTFSDRSQTMSEGSDTYEAAERSANFDPGVVPPSHDRRTLVLCFDGTGDQFDADNSNIVQLFQMLRKDNPSQQLVYYQAGIGTYTSPAVATQRMANLEKLVDMAIAKDLNAHVMSGYEFLMQNYEANDKICIFGFSRGAYTARALAGMLHKVGLLPRCNHQQVPFAYAMFARDDPEGWRQSIAFKKAFSNDVGIDFLGVFDTVASVGIIPKRLPFVQSNNCIRFFRHAISLDEHRAKFKANHYQRTPDDQIHGAAGMPPSNPHRRPRIHRNHLYHHPESSQAHGLAAKEDEHMDENDFDEREGVNGSRWETNVKEVWFAGVHCDVGGGSVPNGTRHSLARIPLRWMIREAFLAGTGIQFHRSSFPGIGINPKDLYPFVVPRPPGLEPTERLVKAMRHEDGSIKKDKKRDKKKKKDAVSDEKRPHAHHSHTQEGTGMTLAEEIQADRGKIELEMTEEEEEIRDALCPMFDTLKLAKAWWILEVLPLRQGVQRPAPETGLVPKVIMNLGRPREIPRSEGKLLVHRSVKFRMEAEGLTGGKYVPKAFPKAAFPVEPTWVD